MTSSIGNNLDWLLRMSKARPAIPNSMDFTYTKSERELNHVKAIKYFEKDHFRKEYEGITKQIKE